MTDDPELRASDADRDRVATMLGEAYATGRLTTVEHADRLEAVYTAKTMGELVPLTRDLPELSGRPSALASLEKQSVSATFSKVVKRGRWIASRHTHLAATFGALIVDLSQAVLPGREITVSVSAFAAKMIIRVPPNAQVIDEVGALFAKRQVSGGEGGDGPVIRIVGTATFGKVIVARTITDWNLHGDA
ncbi:DUF1707 SHOCT-like domain-containing protein [Nonomuraea sp. LPB2021202275-12-8]|uniref:DUF1707 SHOCT-like domain-containing protein n=1 Tax=Nonomuraea sp. LPB2021202275-12-8 TaxID=3120159 RepID=UPI00300C3A2B